ncbi:hypothetical protein [Aequorivita sediminis]|uniref:hypothetical protein n=1 Tax=Aequorivita sediminis TaxID=3073653 RepID=UPI0028A6D1F7|nr:hypothetical protein [Aequorivita sp. F6058]
MDELELLKKQWQSREQELPHLSFNDIYKMLLKRSSSIVKWIFFISIAEIIFWTILSFLVPESNTKFNNDIGINNALIVVNVFNYSVFGVFIYLFYKNYRKISITDSVKELMQNILRARKTVKYFVIYNVTATAVLLLCINIYYYLNQDIVFKYMVEDFGLNNVTQERFMSMFFLSQILIGTVLIVLILLFYRIIYGILMKRLYKNYKELEKIEL